MIAVHEFAGSPLRRCQIAQQMPVCVHHIGVARDIARGYYFARLEAHPGHPTVISQYLVHRCIDPQLAPKIGKQPGECRNQCARAAPGEMHAPF